MRCSTEDDVRSTTILRQEGNAIIATDHQINISELAKNRDRPKETRIASGVSEHEQQAKLFNSIVIHLEEQNHQIMKKLQMLQSQQTGVGNNEHQGHLSSLQDNASSSSFIHQQHPLDSCENMQHQLQRLKSLVDNIFGANLLSEDGGRELANATISQNPKINNPVKVDAISIEDIDGKKKRESDSTINSSKTGNFLPNQRIESTPLCNYKNNPHLNKLLNDENGGSNKLLSRSTIHNEFSPIIPKGMQWKRGKKLELGTVDESSSAVKNSIYSNKFVDRTNSIIAPESIAVDNLLDDHGNSGLRGETIQTTYPEMSQYENVNSADSFPFSRLSLNELTSLLVKTGKIVPNGDSEHVSGQEISPPYNVTRLLDPKLNSTNGNVTGMSGGAKTEIMEELDSLMLRLEDVFEAYHSSHSSKESQNLDKLKRINSVHLQQLQKEQDPMIIGQIVSEIVDQIHSFNYRCLGTSVKTQSHSSSPSIARSEGDGLSSPEPPVLSLSARTQCAN